MLKYLSYFKFGLVLASLIFLFSNSVDDLRAEGVPQKNVLFVLDASNSMWGQIDGRPKIEIAKSILGDLISQMPPDARMGLVAYGHRFDRTLNNCDDMELLNPVGNLSSSVANASFSQIIPKGQTPIANTLTQAANWLSNQRGENNIVVLISDGLESCDGDPCLASKALNDAGISTAIHVVGFDLSNEQSDKLKCIAENGNGQMLLASNAADLASAMNKVRTRIEEPILVAEETSTSPDPTPEPIMFFEEQFDGNELGANWSVINEDLDSYIAEGGEMLIIASPPASTPLTPEMPNIITHSAALPDGNWDIELRFNVELQHGGETVYFGAMNDNENWIAAGISTAMGSGQASLDGFITKVESGNASRFDVIIAAANDTDYADTTQRWRKLGLGEFFGKEAFTLVLSKRGRDYGASGSYGEPDSETFLSYQTESLKMLRGKKNLFIAFGLDSHADGSHQGEGNLIVDYVRVSKVGE